MKLSQLYTKKTDGTIENFNPIVSESDVLPAQSSSTDGKFLKSNGTSSEWATVDSLPEQSSSTENKFLKSTGSAGSETWAEVTVPTKVSDLTNDTGFITSSDNITGSSGSCTGNSATATTATKVGNSLTLKDSSGTSQTFDGSASLDLSAGVYFAANATTATNYASSGGIATALAGKAASSHGNHVPATQTASNSVFLRNDNTWQTVTPANIGAAASSHSHSYEPTTTAVRHSASTAVGSGTQPVYIASNGSATACTYTLGKSVPSNAVFTDTTYSVATTSSNGLMSSSDKSKLNGIAAGAQVNAVTSVNGKTGAVTVASGHTWCTTNATTSSSASSTNPAVVVTNYVNGTSWYRKWSDGWIEQGMRFTSTGTKNWVTSFSTTNISVVASSTIDPSFNASSITISDMNYGPGAKQSMIMIYACGY